MLAEGMLSLGGSPGDSKSREARVCRVKSGKINQVISTGRGEESEKQTGEQSESFKRDIMQSGLGGRRGTRKGGEGVKNITKGETAIFRDSAVVMGKEGEELRLRARCKARSAARMMKVEVYEETLPGRPS